MKKMRDDDPCVREIMIEHPRTIVPQAPAIRAAQMMVQHRIRHLVVAERHEEVVGVISERQILKHFSPWLSDLTVVNDVQKPFPRCEVREIMSPSPVTVTASASIRSAAALMAARKIGCLPVVNPPTRLVGLVTAVDVLKFIGCNRLPDRQEDFSVFSPPAFLTDSGDLTVPLGYFSELGQGEEVLAVLAYAARTKRIGIKVFARGEEGLGMLGARPATLTDKYLTIPAKDFIDHYNLHLRGPLDVSENKQTGYLVLSPVLKP
jgi:CBS domain-containing membrane protein